MSAWLPGVLVDKFCYHLPLYRQRQRMGHGGVTVARPTLTNWVHRGRGLLEPIYRAQLRQILQSRTLAIDETPVKAGRAKGKMKTAWYWPIYGEDDEVAFTFAPTRGRAHLDAVLEGFTGNAPVRWGQRLRELRQRPPRADVAQCWTHTRRNFVEAEDADPGAVAEALELIGALYAVEQQLDGR